uniref:Uncharacterized protein n=1 Tax=Rhizophora mucronata TaxID=61149 RepID=A0A2P2QUS3_RHIMU
MSLAIFGSQIHVDQHMIVLVK